MPNWSTNTARYTGTKEDISKLKDLMGPGFDFNELVPMPESLERIDSPANEACILAFLTDGFKKPVDDDIAQKVWKICHGDSIFGFLREDSELKKRYAEISKTVDPDEMVYLCFTTDEESVKISRYEKGRIYAENFEKYGAATWYEWRCEHWGTKWPASDVEMTEDTDTSVEWRFYTAWAMPAAIYAAIESKFPMLSSKISWMNEDTCNVRHTIEYMPPYWLDEEGEEV